MPRLSIETRMLDLVERDHRAAVIPKAAVGVWLLLARLAEAQGGAVTFCDTMPDTAAVAVWLRMPVSELASAIETLTQTGALKPTETGFAFPPWAGVASRADAASRSEINRQNGMKGGRPRRDGSPAQRRLPLVCALPGGRSETAAETEPQTEPGGATNTNFPSEKDLIVAPETEASAIAAEAGEACGLKPAAWRRGIGHVDTWLALGADRALILGVVRAMIAGAKPGQIYALGFFDGPVRRAIGGPAAAHVHARGAAEVRDPASVAFQAAIQRWAENGCRGRGPRLEDFAQGAAA